MSPLELAADDFAKIVADWWKQSDPLGLYSVARKIALQHGVAVEDMLEEFDRQTRMRVQCLMIGR